MKEKLIQRKQKILREFESSRMCFNTFRAAVANETDGGAASGIPPIPLSFPENQALDAAEPGTRPPASALQVLFPSPETTFQHIERDDMIIGQANEFMDQRMVSSICFP